MSIRPTVWGIPCPGDLNDERLTLPYRIWFAAYRTNQQVHHRLGLHQRQRHYSIAPRCDWCGYRSPEQVAIAKRNREESA